LSRVDMKVVEIIRGHAWLELVFGDDTIAEDQILEPYTGVFLEVKESQHITEESHNCSDKEVGLSIDLGCDQMVLLGVTGTEDKEVIFFHFKDKSEAATIKKSLERCTLMSTHGKHRAFLIGGIEELVNNSLTCCQFRHR
jgi:hypothetical protein